MVASKVSDFTFYRTGTLPNDVRTLSNKNPELQKYIRLINNSPYNNYFSLLSVNIFVQLSICHLICPFLYPSIYFSIHLSIYLSIYPFRELKVIDNQQMLMQMSHTIEPSKRSHKTSS